MNSTVLSGSEIDHPVLSHGEVNAEAASIDKGHIALLVALDSAEHILLIRVSFAFQLHKLSELETLLHAPLDDAAVPGDRHE